MNTLTEQQQKLAQSLWAIVDFIEAHRNKQCSLWDCNRGKLFRFAAFCYYTGKLCVSWEEGKITAVVFYWPDWKEHIEAKDAEGMSQFEWTQVHEGDAIFVSDVFGERKAIARMYQAWLEKFPHLITVPIYSYRKGKLTCLYGKVFERFMFGKEHQL